MKLAWTLVLLLSLVRPPEAGARRPSRYSGPRWWGIAAGLPTAQLRRRQRRLLRTHPGLLDSISRGLKMAVAECRFQLRDRRWNCPVMDPLWPGRRSLFGPLVTRAPGCRETAFLHAVTTAGLTHALARACSEGQVETCGCQGDWRWGGCSDDARFALRLSRRFVDGGERGRGLQSSLNLHNNEAGRLLAVSDRRQQCKCHGMSGSCSIRTCWSRLSPFRSVGSTLLIRYDGASRVQVSNLGNLRRRRVPLQLARPGLRPPGRKDLVYVDKSPNFCTPNFRLGTEGTVGRVCLEEEQGPEGCDVLCCGRGYSTRVVEHVSRCNCTFQWCCQVECQQCSVIRALHTCLPTAVHGQLNQPF